MEMILIFWLFSHRLLDFTSIASKRVASTSAAAKVNGIVKPKKPVKKTPKEDEVAKFLENSVDTEKLIETEEEKSEDENASPIVTEEQFLKEQNDILKEQLLEDSSDSDMVDDDSDMEVVNGKLSPG